jgi:hypothetical protein
VELFHGGQGDGEGLVEWTAQQKTRHRSRREAATPPHMQLLDFVIRAGHPSAETIERHKKGNYPVSTLARALTTPRVRERLGIDIVSGKVVTDYPKTEVLKGLTKLVDDIGTGAVKVGDLMSKEDRARYVNKLSTADLPDPSTRTSVSAPLDEAPEKATGSTTKSKDRRHSSSRTRMIPADFTVAIAVSRINDIYHELKRKVTLNDAPNAVAVLFRTFIELSIDDYIKRNPHLAKLAGWDKKLQQKANGVLDDLEANAVMSKAETLPVREALRDPDKLTLVTNLNAFVHNPDMTPSANDLRAVWDKFAHLIEALWA